MKNANVEILSLFEDKLLVSGSKLFFLLIISLEGRLLSTIETENDSLFDASWTPRGNIVYTVWDEKKLVVKSESGEIIVIHHNIADPCYFSTSSEGIIYVADTNTCLYQSKDDGISWNHVFSNTDGKLCALAIKITTNNVDDFWVLQSYNTFLTVYSLNRKHTPVTYTWNNVNVPSIIRNHIRAMVYDDKQNIFLSDSHREAVHIISVNSQHHSHILSSIITTNCSHGLAFDKKYKLLYVGQNNGLVEMFDLSYGFRNK